MEQHNSRLDLLEQRWHENNSTAECHDLCQLPSYILHDSTQTLWSEDNAYDVDEAFADGAVFKRKYFADAQHFFALSSPLASKGPKDWGASPNQRVSIQKGPPVQGQISTPKTIKSQAENRVSWKCSKARPSRVRPQKCTGQHYFNSALLLVFGHSSAICSDISA